MSSIQYLISFLTAGGKTRGKRASARGGAIGKATRKLIILFLVRKTSSLLARRNKLARNKLAFIPADELTGRLDRQDVDQDLDAGDVSSCVTMVFHKNMIFIIISKTLFLNKFNPTQSNSRPSTRAGFAICKSHNKFNCTNSTPQMVALLVGTRRVGSLKFLFKDRGCPFF